MAEAKDDFSAGDPLLASQVNVISQNANNSFRDDINSGETINGGTLPVAVFQNDTDNELYACDGDDTSKLKFIGFVISNSTDGNPIEFQSDAIVRGFSGLSEGEKYYVQDDKTIGTSPGTNEVIVGIAISETDLLIFKGRRYASGTHTFSATATSTKTIGFRPSLIKISLSFDTTNNFLNSLGAWTIFGGNNCIYQTLDTNGNITDDSIDASNAWRMETGASLIDTHIGLVDTITDISFRLNNTKVNSPGNIILHWEAFGDF